MSTFDESWKNCLETVEDRTSPEIWPEQIPGVSEFVSLNSISQNSLPQPWMNNFDADDIKLLQHYGCLSFDGLIAEVKKLHDVAYTLGKEEAKEMTTGKFLKILSKNKF